MWGDEDFRIMWSTIMAHEEVLSELRKRVEELERILRDLEREVRTR